jgi:hypothetical protein
VRALEQHFLGAPSALDTLDKQYATLVAFIDKYNFKVLDRLYQLLYIDVTLKDYTFLQCKLHTEKSRETQPWECKIGNNTTFKSFDELVAIMVENGIHDDIPKEGIPTWKPDETTNKPTNETAQKPEQPKPEQPKLQPPKLQPPKQQANQTYTEHLQNMRDYLKQVFPNATVLYDPRQTFIDIQIQRVQFRLSIARSENRHTHRIEVVYMTTKHDPRNPDPKIYALYPKDIENHIRHNLKQNTNTHARGTSEEQSHAQT